MPVTARVCDDYELRDADLQVLYAKAKRTQWDIDRDIDWHTELDPANPLGMPDATLLVYGTDVWSTLDERGRSELRRQAQGWLLSQILHGEQAAMICAAKIACAHEDLSARLFAATQVMDEARHIEAYARLVNDKVGVRYPLGRALQALLEDTITSSALDITSLGMQILVEGIALSIFQSIVAYSANPFIKDLLARIQRDEARHFAAGRLSLQPVFTELSASERREREDFVCEGASLLHEHLCADEIWEPMGLHRRECARQVRISPVARSIRRSIFRRLVPSVRDLGLLTGAVRRTFEQLDVIAYEALPAVVETT